jgi:hypothetical protein
LVFVVVGNAAVAEGNAHRLRSWNETPGLSLVVVLAAPTVLPDQAKTRSYEQGRRDEGAGSLPAAREQRRDAKEIRVFAPEGNPVVVLAAETRRWQIEHGFQAR